MRLVSHPVLCNYYVTYRCNASCSFCDIWQKPSPYAAPEKIWCNLLDLKKLGVKVIDFTGGEPLMHPVLDKLLEYAKKLGFITTITTNTLLYPKKADKLKGKIDMLHFSLDYASAPDHDRSRGVKSYEFVMKSIEKALMLGERPDILMTIFNDNLDQIEPVYQNICLPNNLLLILNPVFSYPSIDTSLSDQNLEQLKRWGQQKNIYLNQAFIQLRLDGGNHTRRPVCKAGSSSIVISPFNELVLPCYHLGLKKLPINNSLYNLYQSPPVQALIEMEGRYPACEGCTINCYMQSSFAVEMNKYWWKALPSTLKYNRIKGTWKQLIKI
ncbi:MAG: radical SAM protein [Candidatus Cyclobacteriaceae bacterium M3_2C_046]